jgi:hypothetical protein
VARNGFEELFCVVRRVLGEKSALSILPQRSFHTTTIAPKEQSNRRHYLPLIELVFHERNLGKFVPFEDNELQATSRTPNSYIRLFLRLLVDLASRTPLMAAFRTSFVVQIHTPREAVALFRSAACSSTLFRSLVDERRPIPILVSSSFSPAWATNCKVLITCYLSASMAYHLFQAPAKGPVMASEE